MVWYGVVWYGMVRYGKGWCGTVARFVMVYCEIGKDKTKSFSVANFKTHDKY